MELLTKGYGLVEGPLWVPERGLLFSDVHGGGVYAIDADKSVETVFPHRRGIGGMASHEGGGVVVGGRNIAFKSFAGGESVVLLDSDPDHGNVGFNDLTTDAAGRIYVGSLGSPVFEPGEQRPGNLHLIDLDGSSRIVAEDVLLTNGLGFSPDGATLYHSDSRRQSIHCYDVAENGDLGPKRLFAETPTGAPDGLAVATDGTVWVAIAGGGVVSVFDPNGTLRENLDVPMPMVTSVCFGGNDLRDLYVVTGSDGVEGDRAGAVFRTRVETPGLAVPLARVRVG